MTSHTAPVESPAPLARVVPRDQHTVSRSQISPNALRVLYRLKDAGFQGFLVGGCVRDLLLGLRPKDFDVATILAYALTFILIVQLIESLLVQPMVARANKWRR